MGTWLSGRLEDVTNFTSSVEVITASKTMTSGYDNGKTFVFGAAGPLILTLPPVATTSFRCTILIGFAITSNCLVTSAEGTNMEGAFIVAGSAVTVNAASALSFVATAENIGDRMELVSDGTYWHVTGVALNTGGMTAA